MQTPHRVPIATARMPPLAKTFPWETTPARCGSAGRQSRHQRLMPPGPIRRRCLWATSRDRRAPSARPPGLPGCTAIRLNPQRRTLCLYQRQAHRPAWHDRQRSVRDQARRLLRNRGLCSSRARWRMGRSSRSACPAAAPSGSWHASTWEPDACGRHSGRPILRSRTQTASAPDSCCIALCCSTESPATLPAAPASSGQVAPAGRRLTRRQCRRRARQANSRQPGWESARTNNSGNPFSPAPSHDKLPSL